MSENLDLVRSIYADWERGNYFAGWGERFDPNAELVIADGPEPGAWRGPRGLLEGAQIILKAWEDLRSRAQEYRVLDAERILVLVSFIGRGRASGLEVEQTLGRGASVFHVHGGQVRKLVLYWDRDRALADLGLAE